MDEDFKLLMQSNIGCAVIMAGSDSDKFHIDKIVESLEKYEIPYDVRICSAHKQPAKLMNLIDDFNKVGGLVSYIAVAGKTDALSGTLSFHMLAPVISCPPDNPNTSCLNNPSGSSNAYISKPENVGKFIAQMYAAINPKYKEILEREINEKISILEKADSQIQDGNNWNRGDNK